MAVHVNITKSKLCKEKTSNVHHMPCLIKRDGPANVSKYLEPNISKEQDGTLTASFRGRPILGKEMKVPKNYQGVVLQETRERFNKDADRNVYMTATFDKFTYWNYDQMPSSNDEIVSVMDWIDIASAVSFV